MAEKRRATTFRTSKGTIVNVQYPDIYVSPAFLSSEDVTSPAELKGALREELGEAVSKLVIKPTGGTNYSQNAGAPFVFSNDIGTYLGFHGGTLNPSRMNTLVADIDADCKISNVRNVVPALAYPGYVERTAQRWVYHGGDGCFYLFASAVPVAGNRVIEIFQIDSNFNVLRRVTLDPTTIGLPEVGNSLAVYPAGVTHAYLFYNDGATHSIIYGLDVLNVWTAAPIMVSMGVAFRSEPASPVKDNCEPFCHAPNMGNLITMIGETNVNHDIWGYFTSKMYFGGASFNSTTGVYPAFWRTVQGLDGIQRVDRQGLGIYHPHITALPDNRMYNLFYMESFDYGLNVTTFRGEIWKRRISRDILNPYKYGEFEHTICPRGTAIATPAGIHTNPLPTWFGDYVVVTVESTQAGNINIYSGASPDDVELYARVTAAIDTIIPTTSGKHTYRYNTPAKYTIFEYVPSLAATGAVHLLMRNTRGA